MGEVLDDSERSIAPESTISTSFPYNRLSNVKQCDDPLSRPKKVFFGVIANAGRTHQTDGLAIIVDLSDDLGSTYFVTMVDEGRASVGGYGRGLGSRPSPRRLRG